MFCVQSLTSSKSFLTASKEKKKTLCGMCKLVFNTWALCSRLSNQKYIDSYTVWHRWVVSPPPPVQPLVVLIPSLGTFRCSSASTTSHATVPGCNETYWTWSCHVTDPLAVYLRIPLSRLRCWCFSRCRKSQDVRPCHWSACTAPLGPVAITTGHRVAFNSHVQGFHWALSENLLTLLHEGEVC